jgi:ABC-type multidrug transport system ATPase subunit/pSer/pThr/pTyr-binding forkhead associated (FHA) protein
MSAYLAILSGLPSQVFTLEPGTAVAGRAPDAEIELTHVEISRHHCRFIWNGTQCLVEDMGSVRGTRVNGERIVVVTALEPGDEIGIGPAILKYAVGDLPAAKPQPAASEIVADAEMLVRGVRADRIEVDAELTLGRDPEADVWLNDPAVSRQHASVKPGPHGGCIVSDLNSSGGSFVNGHRFDTHELTVGDRLQVGPFTFQFDGHALHRVAQTSGGRIDATGLFAKAESGQVILDDVTLHIAPSRFVGILGPSGAGKSSLLHTLAGMRAPQGGLALVNGADVYTGGGLSGVIGFVPQEDIVHPELRVSEALRFAARLRLPADTPDLELQKLILQTMDQLGLREHADKPIARLSGGQRKRVSVGAELLAKPSILFLDEPSSGLDPATEFQLMELLRDLADTGCTIVCTTHIMENAYLMDQLVVLTGGCLAFQGSAQEAREYFGVPKLTALYDRMLERPAREWRDEFAAKAGEGGQTAAPPAQKDPPRTIRRPFALPILLQRQFAILHADWRNFLLLLGQPLIIAALVAWVSDDRSLILFFAYIATLWLGCSNAAQEIVKERAIYQRERLVGVGAHAYLASKFLFLTALTSLQGLLLYGAVSAFERGLGGTAWWQLLGILGTALAAVGIGAAISAWSRSVMQAVMIVPLVLIPQILFSGFTVEVRDMRPSVLVASGFMPSFAAESVMDTSFLWRQRIVGDLISDHPKPVSNLRARAYVKTGSIFENPAPASLGLLTHVLWAAACYVFAGTALGSRKRS